MDERSLEELATAAEAARAASDFVSLEDLARAFIDIGESTGNTEAAALGNYHMGTVLTRRNAGSEAAHVTRIAIELFSARGDRFNEARATMNLGTIEFAINGNTAAASRLYGSSIPVFREFDERLYLAIALGNIGEVFALDGDYGRALANSEESLEIFRTLNRADYTAWQLINSAHYRHRLRRHESVAEPMREAYDLLRVYPDPRWIAWYFDVTVLITADLGRLDDAAKLLAFTDRYRDEHGQPRNNEMLLWFSSTKERIARELSDDAFETLVSEGESLTIESAQQLIELG